MIVTIYKPSRYLVEDLQDKFFVGDTSPEAVKVYNICTVFRDGTTLYMKDDDSNVLIVPDCTFTYFDCV